MVSLLVVTRISLVGLADDSAHWSERARLLAPSRSVYLLQLLVPFVLGCFASVMGSIVPLWACSLIGLFEFCLLFLCSLAITLPLQRVVCETSYGGYLRSVVCGQLVYAPTLVLMFVGVIVMPATPNMMFWILSVVFILLWIMFGLGGGLRVARLLGLARPASQRLCDIVARCSERLQIPQPRATYQLNWLSVNALAFPLTQELAFSQRLVDSMSDDDIEAICFHEMGHLQERYPWLRLAGTFQHLPFLWTRIAILNGWYIQMAVAFMALLITSRLLVGWSQRREHDADELAADNEKEAGQFARALETVYRMNMLPVVQAVSTTHPNLYDRLEAVGITPDYPRPPKPSSFQQRSVLILGIVLVAVPVAIWLAWLDTL